MAERLCESASCEALSRSSGATCLTRAFKVSSGSFLQIVYALKAALRAKLFLLLTAALLAASAQPLAVLA
jgi:hypothetical protein